jgi:hypothetical protein
MNIPNGKIKYYILILFIITISTTGCLDNIDLNLKNDTVYKAHPTKVQYDLKYGYIIDCNGSGEYNINYDCDLPETLLGSISFDILHPYDFKNIIIENNSIIKWNISGKNTNSYQLGINSSILSESFIVSDLNGKNALSLQEIEKFYPDYINKYCKPQSDNNITYIDPYNSKIKTTAKNIMIQSNSNNSFILAKELFIWLKKNTFYKTHINNRNAQPSIMTYNLGSGDCDDISFLYISLCRSINIPSRFVNGFLLEEDNGIISVTGHAWVEVFVGFGISNDGWVPVECSCCANIETEINQNFGVEDVSHLRLFEDNGTNESLNLSFSGPKVIFDTKINVNFISFVEINDYKIIESKELSVDKNGYRFYK